MKLQDFLEGMFHVLAFRGQRRVPLVPNVFEEGLAATVDAVEKHAKREKIHFAFRVKAGTLAQPRSELSRAIRRLEKAGVIRIAPGDKPQAELLFSPDAAYAELAATHLPIGLLERAAKLFYRHLQVGQIRASLAGLAMRGRAQRRG